jgi:hypothetical protein
MVEDHPKLLDDLLSEQAFMTQQDDPCQVGHVYTKDFNSPPILRSYSPTPISKPSLDLEVRSSELTTESCRENEIALKTGIEQSPKECTKAAYSDPYLNIRIVPADHYIPRLSLSTQS